MFADWMTKLETVHRAVSAPVREAIYRFRYTVYVEELHKTVCGADHTLRMIRDAEDEHPGSILLYTGAPDDITGTMRVDVWEPGHVPASFVRRYSLASFPEIEKYTVCETARLMVAGRLRGKLILPALSREGYKCAAERKSYFVFCYCAPGLVPAYRRLGSRPYAGDLISADDGLRVPMVNLTTDIRYYRTMNSPMLSLAKEHYGDHQPPGFELGKYAQILDGASATEADQATVWNQLEDELSRDGQPTLFDDLPPAAAKSLLDQAYALDVRPGQVVTRAELVEQEMFIIVEGTFEVLAADGRRLAVLSKGDVFGELAMFLPSGRRTASIRASTVGKIVMLRRKYLRELIDSQPQVASQVLFNLGRVMATRMASMIDGAR